VFTLYVQCSRASVDAKKSLALMLFSISSVVSYHLHAKGSCILSSCHAGINKQCFYLGYSGDSVSVSEELGSLALNEPYSLSF